KIFVGTDDDNVFSRLEPILSQLGDPLHVGGVGSGASAKLVANSTLFAVLCALGEAIALGERLGLSREKVFDVLAATALAESAEARMLDMTYTTLVVHRAVYAAVVLGIPDVIGDGSPASDEIAESVGADADTTYRLMRTLASAGVLREADDRRFSLTELGATLRDDVEGSMRGWVLFSGSSF